METGTGRPNRNVGPLLATFFTLLYALIPCLLIVVAGSDNPYGDWTIILGGFGLFATLIYFVRRFVPASIQDGSFLILRDRRDSSLGDYEPRKKARRRRTRFGTNEPPTVDQVRKIREESSTTTWRPRGG